MSAVLEQLKKRRKELGLKQKDMMLRVGMSPQQYQKLEANGNPRLDTLELIAKGLKGEILLIPQDKLAAVKAVLAQTETTHSKSDKAAPDITVDPWIGVFGDNE